MRTDAKPTGSDRYRLFLRCCEAHARVSRLLPRLRQSGCDPRVIFVCLRAYIENRDQPRLDRDRKNREKAYRSIVRCARREYGVPQDVALWLHGRADQAFNTRKKGTHQTESLVWLEFYLRKRGVLLTVTDLAYLIDRAYKALGREESADGSVEALQKELARFKRRNPRYVQLLKADLRKPPTITE